LRNPKRKHGLRTPHNIFVALGDNHRNQQETGPLSFLGMGHFIFSVPSRNQRERDGGVLRYVGVIIGGMIGGRIS